MENAFDMALCVEVCIRLIILVLKTRRTVYCIAIFSGVFTVNGRRGIMNCCSCFPFRRQTTRSEPQGAQPGIRRNAFRRTAFRELVPFSRSEARRSVMGLWLRNVVCFCMSADGSENFAYKPSRETNWATFKNTVQTG